jgi:hypothetical protein
MTEFFIGALIGLGCSLIVSPTVISLLSMWSLRNADIRWRVWMVWWAVVLLLAVLGYGLLVVGIQCISQR